jgi:hypothetical protein
MTDTYNPKQEGYGGHGSYQLRCMADCKDVGEYLPMQETFTYKGCEVTHHTNSSGRSGGLHDTFNLRDIDPNSIQVAKEPEGSRDYVGVSAQVKLSTRNDLSLLDYTGNVTGKTSFDSFNITDSEYAERFAKAFKHAVELCGGKPSTF